MSASTASMRGFSLPELMVAMVIGLVLTLAVSVLVLRQESFRRGVSSGNDLTSNAAYAAYFLDRELRSAGAGFSQTVAENYGCLVHASRDKAQLLPAARGFPAPFSAVPGSYRLVPLVVFAGAGANGSDVIAVATGNAGLGESSLPVAPKSVTAERLTLSNTLGMRAGDLALLSQVGLGCMVQQVNAGFVGGRVPVLEFGGSYAAETIGGLGIRSFSTGNSFVTLLGNLVGNQPRLELLGIGAGGTLFAYDLLQLNADGSQPLVEGVVDLRVRYGVDTGKGGQVDAWVAPSTAGFTAAELTNASVASQGRLQSILAVRIGLVLRSDLVDKTEVTPASLTLFSDLDEALRYRFAVPAGTTNQRYRVVEFTVPLRNIRDSR
ncbi:type IV pilus assembly protein PilW [Pelomonas saccharophila]|uniref:Type IV pilus assembly protein PilW n=1 Tax=Roseateles saccharophilus TaxID=304 RepID=A0ABU1YR41_ROSSA|nr:PilW family protein [Roseateles saccharophilus]MDR7271319.1 type IV pilus assembly protein PilW [Roseateles saccharophilus]